MLNKRFPIFVITTALTLSTLAPANAHAGWWPFHRQKKAAKVAEPALPGSDAKKGDDPHKGDVAVPGEKSGEDSDEPKVPGPVAAAPAPVASSLPAPVVSSLPEPVVSSLPQPGPSELPAPAPAPAKKPKREPDIVRLRKLTKELEVRADDLNDELVKKYLSSRLLRDKRTGEVLDHEDNHALIRKTRDDLCTVSKELESLDVSMTRIAGLQNTIEVMNDRDKHTRFYRRWIRKPYKWALRWRIFRNSFHAQRSADALDKSLSDLEAREQAVVDSSGTAK